MTYCEYCGADLPPNKQVRGNKQIKIEELIPYMRKGWVAMDKNGKWCWFESEPTLLREGFNIWLNSGRCKADWLRTPFNIKPAEDWTKSLMKVGGK